MSNIKDIEYNKKNPTLIQYIKVQFANDGRLYTYKTVVDSVKVTDFVVVSTLHGLQLARVMEVLTTIPELDYQVKAVYAILSKLPRQVLDKAGLHV